MHVITYPWYDEIKSTCVSQTPEGIYLKWYVQQNISNVPKKVEYAMMFAGSKSIASVPGF